MRNKKKKEQDENDDENDVETDFLFPFCETASIDNNYFLLDM